ncbi:MAG: DUF4386 family protein [Chloroflexi bacterium]|nr:DUF4386 family protein [Chloroflexota bacterium]
MKNLSFIQVTGMCAILAFAFFFVAIILFTVSGLEERGKSETGQALLNINKYRTTLLTVLWLSLAGKVLAFFVAIGLYQLLHKEGSLLWIAAALWVAGVLFNVISDIVSIGVAWELAPGYAKAAAADKPILEVVARTVFRVGDLATIVGNVLSWGIGLALFAVAILRTGVIPRWIGWLGVIPALIGGWLPLLEPLSDIIKSVGFFGFFIFLMWLIIIGFAMLRLQQSPSIAKQA